MKGQFAQADSAFREALGINRTLFGERHERMAILYGQLAQVRYQVGETDEGVRLGRESLTRFREVLGDEHINTLITASILARLLEEAGRAAEAESLANTTLARLDSANHAHRPHYIAAQRTLGAAILAQHRTDEALPILERALDMSRREFGADSWRTAHAQLSYGKALLVKRRYGDAATVLHEAHAILQKHRTDQPRLAAQCSAAMAMLAARSNQ
jgi:tetratricopeptide (TPR) repeat protein